ncbi:MULTISPECIES: ABC transporter substrate-binding protein [unclassified Neptuniibacter]|uniref:ABC transporter substrate-binding protein n=1 Tax=unclassified Neptuniibacter TaxID=2630693 RepID=UPI0025FCB0C2|nr:MULTISPECIES: ABC transporter substrate-binding protein [unclassified Neptuniibacter]|tara:strand:- start:5618 stop:6622 length:1005 start_codon:yes stop_codon:yes gene_type:complete
MPNYLKVLLLGLFSIQAYANDYPNVRVATLQHGTVNWEMDVIRHHKLDKKYNFTLSVTPVGGKNASAVALQSKAVDIMFSDWIWVNRQRFSDRMYGFSPVSAAAGGLYAQPDAGVSSISDLSNHRVGIAGGAVDKSWLLLQAYTKQNLDRDLKELIQPVFAAPPLLNKLMYDRKLPLSLNFWHYSAKLKAKGFKQVISINEVIKGLGVETQVPLVGWVFSEAWRERNEELLGNFLKASQEAREILLKSDKEWTRIRSLTRAENEEIFQALKHEYRVGVLKGFGKTELDALDHLYSIMAGEGGAALTGGANQLDRTLFWLPDSNVGVTQLESGVK